MTTTITCRPDASNAMKRAVEGIVGGHALWTASVVDVADSELGSMTVQVLVKLTPTPRVPVPAAIAMRWYGRLVAAYDMYRVVDGLTLRNHRGERGDEHIELKEHGGVVGETSVHVRDAYTPMSKRYHLVGDLDRPEEMKRSAKLVRKAEERLLSINHRTDRAQWCRENIDLVEMEHGETAASDFQSWYEPHCLQLDRSVTGSPVSGGDDGVVEKRMGEFNLLQAQLQASMDCLLAWLETHPCSTLTEDRQ